jgi:small-conductance mechanosensitive channel/CRP-like cAMP-binding protein
MTLDNWLVLVQAIGLGLALALMLWLLRETRPARRLQISVLVLVVLGVGYLFARPQQGASLGRVFMAVGVLLIAFTILQLLDVLVWHYLLGERQRVQVPRLLIDVFNFVALTIVVLGILNGVFGVKVADLLFTSTVLSAVIGLALQDTLGNLISGLALQLERPFTVGDWVLIAGLEGQITQLNWRSLTLRTRDNNNVFVTNAYVAKNTVINLSRPAPLQRMHAQVGVAYHHAPGHVKAALVHAMSETEGVLPDPGPKVQVKSYSDSYIQYDLVFWVNDLARMMDIQDAVLTRVWYVLRREGLTIPAPQREVTVRTLAEDHVARAQEQLRNDLFADLRPVPVLAPLNDGEIRQLARQATLHLYAPGEALVRQGEAGDSLFVVKAGRVCVEVTREGGAVTRVATLGEREFFGEMSLLTGEPRSASIFADTEVEVIVVAKAAISELLQADTALLERLSLALEARMQNTAEQVAASAEAARLNNQRLTQQIALLHRIQRFFGMGE